MKSPENSEYRQVEGRSPIWGDRASPYCPGCGHGIIQRLVCEVLEELDQTDKCVFMAPVGCSILAYTLLNLDICQPAHGRTPAVATGIKRARPDTFVISYQGDGDLAAIGTAEIVHAAARGEHFSTIFVNNAVYGMTGGQMAPTTLAGQKTTTTPEGRSPADGMGHPIDVCGMLAGLDGVDYLARTSIHTAKHVMQTKTAIRKAFTSQLRRRGFSLVEILSPCPVNWRLSPVESMEFIGSTMTGIYPLGEFRVNGVLAEGPATGK